MTTRFIFVGERPSQRAWDSNATWQNGRLAAFTLHAALRACGLMPEEQVFFNLWGLPEPCPDTDPRHERLALYVAAVYARSGLTVVGMGQKVCRVLQAAGIPHRPMRHPAARGALRKREVYQAHVREVLNGRTA